MHIFEIGCLEQSDKRMDIFQPDMVHGRPYELNQNCHQQITKNEENKWLLAFQENKSKHKRGSKIRTLCNLNKNRRQRWRLALKETNQNTQEVKRERVWYGLDKTMCTFSAKFTFDKGTNRYKTRNVENSNSIFARVGAFHLRFQKVTLNVYHISCFSFLIYILLSLVKINKSLLFNLDLLSWTLAFLFFESIE